MRLHAIIHKAVPLHGAGAEHYLHAMFKWLTQRGHVCSASVSQAEGDWELDGVRYVGERRPDPAPVRDAHVVITHLDQTRHAVMLCSQANRPLCHLVHNDRQLAYHRVRPRDAALVVFNSRWVAAASRWRGPQMVMPPPVFPQDYRVRGGRHDALVLVNLTAEKGAGLFWELAAAEPERRFIGVLGAYGEQIVPEPGHPNPYPNVEIWENCADPREIYREARLILMPSAYESWGRVPIEAAASGIPTIAHATPGLLESLGPAGTFADRGSLQDWRWALQLLDDVVVYGRASDAAIVRSTRLYPEPELEALERELAIVAEKRVGVGAR